MEAVNPLGVEPIGKLLRKFALPSCISLIVNALYNIVDQIFIGRGVGYLGNGATNVIMPYTVLAIGLGMLIGDGCAAYFSMALGRKEQEHANRSVQTAIMTMILVGVVYCVISSLMLTPLCRLTGATDKLLPYSVEYGRVIFLGFPICIFECAMSSIIRTDGSPGFSMAGLLAGCITNVILDYILVFPMGMGMRGAAIATVCGQIVNAVMFIIYIFRLKHIQLSRSDWKISGYYLKKMLSLGLASFVTQMAVVVIMIVTNRVLVYFGGLSKYGAEIPLTAFGITMKINNILIAIMSGIGAGVLPIIGYNYGAGQIDRVKSAAKMAVITAMVCGAIATVFFQLFPEQILSIFGTESDLYTEFGVKSLRIFLLMCTLDGMNNVVPVCFQAMGKPKYASLASMMRQVILNVPPVIIFPFIVGVVGALYNGPIAMTGAFIINIFLLKKVFAELQKLKMVKTE